MLSGSKRMFHPAAKRTQLRLQDYRETGLKRLQLRIGVVAMVRPLFWRCARFSSHAHEGRMAQVTSASSRQAE
jgi:hypothetical protein